MVVHLCRGTEVLVDSEGVSKNKGVKHMARKGPFSSRGAGSQIEEGKRMRN